MGCGSGGITVLFVWKFHPTGGKWSLSKIINGCLAGMVSICAGCNSYYPWIASGIASVAGVVYIFLSLLMVRLRIDDPLDAVAVHAGSGKWISNINVRDHSSITSACFWPFSDPPNHPPTLSADISISLYPPYTWHQHFLFAHVSIWPPPPTSLLT